MSFSSSSLPDGAIPNSFTVEGAMSFYRDGFSIEGAVGLGSRVCESSSNFAPYPHETDLLPPTYEIVDPAFKRSKLLSLALRYNIPLSDTLAVGDGPNELPMLNAAGLGIAWKANPRVQQEAPQRLNGGSLEDLIRLLGPHGNQIAARVPRS